MQLSFKLVGNEDLNTLFFNNQIITFTILIRFNLGNLSAHGYYSDPSYIAIDDISFSPECIATTEQSSTTPIPIRTTPSKCGNQFHCKLGTCIDSSKVCNFHKDCDDGSDESNCGTCGFEDTDPNGIPVMCGWNNIGFGKGEWTVVSASILAKYYGLLATTDATGKANGKYLIIDTSKGWLELNKHDKIISKFIFRFYQGGSNTNNPAVIETPTFGPTAPSCKIDFLLQTPLP